MRRTQRLAPFAVLAIGLAITGCAATPIAPTATPAPTTGAGSAPGQAIQPMTTVTEHPKQGYFSDPYPIHLAAGNSTPATLSGTTQDLLSCQGRPTPDCFHASPISTDIGPDLAQQASAAGSTLHNGFNHNIFQDDSGQWQMAVSYYVSSSRHPNTANWTVILHAHATGGTGDAVPAHWVADSLIVGSFSNPTKADYDGKYFEADQKLYLVYSKRLSAKPARDGIVAQPMNTAASPAATQPTVLLAPGDYDSELFFGLNQPNTFKLIETGNLTEVDGKYVLAYSTGAYDEPDYKIGLAWSDTFLPSGGTGYRKITTPDTAGVWGKAGGREVRYLLQSQESGWPGYVAGTVLAPGVPAVVEDDQHWYLTFAGYLPSDAPPDPKTGHYVPSSRRPFFAPLSVRIPAGATVAKTSDTDLANWITVGPAG